MGNRMKLIKDLVKDQSNDLGNENPIMIITNRLSESHIVDGMIVYMIEILKDFYRNYKAYTRINIEDIKLNIIDIMKLRKSVINLDRLITGRSIDKVESVQYFISEGNIRRTRFIGKLLLAIRYVGDDIIANIEVVSKIFARCDLVQECLFDMINDMKLLNDIYVDAIRYDEFYEFVDDIIEDD